jgi:hypothetical protein
MDHRTDAATQVFGQVCELSDALQKRIQARGWEALDYTAVTQREGIPRQGRRRLLTEGWRRVCEILEDIEEEERLSSHSRMLLRVCLGHAQHFVGIILHLFYTRNVLKELLTGSRWVQDLYGNFVQYATANHDDLCCRLLVVREVKDSLSKIQIQLRQHYAHSSFYLHRVQYEPYTQQYTSASLGKRVVIDPPDPALFPSDNFYIMNSAKSFVLQPLSNNHLEIHALVTQDCPYSSHELRDMLRPTILMDNQDHFDADWLVLLVIYNLDSVPAVRNWLKQTKGHLSENIRKRTNIVRSSNKQDTSIKASYPSRMVGLGDVTNQSGGVEPYLNIYNRRESHMQSKYELLQDSDFILDGLVAVASPSSIS